MDHVLELATNLREVDCTPCDNTPLVLQKVASEADPKVRNHGEGPYQGLLLVESGYYRFHI